MCGLAGIIFGARRRSPDELEYLTGLFTRLLVISQQRGPHATGIALLNRDGQHRLFKRPMPAKDFVEHKAFAQLLASVSNSTTLLLGHTRWRTRGDEHINRNNHPIRAGDVIGIHNGTIYNADELFRRYRLPRFAEVDSEILLRMAATTAADGVIDIVRFKRRLRSCHGQLAAVMASRRDPRTVLMLKGNNPLELRWNSRLRVVLYASAASYLDAMLTAETNWSELRTPRMMLFTFRHEDLTAYSSEAISFIARGSQGASDLGKAVQRRFEDM